jgi:hypothetical protein
VSSLVSRARRSTSRASARGALQTRDRDGRSQAPDQRSITSRFALGAAAHPGHESDSGAAHVADEGRRSRT